MMTQRPTLQVGKSHFSLATEITGILIDGHRAFFSLAGFHSELILSNGADLAYLASRLPAGIGRRQRC